MNINNNENINEDKMNEEDLHNLLKSEITNLN